MTMHDELEQFGTIGVRADEDGTGASETQLYVSAPKKRITLTIERETNVEVELTRKQATDLHRALGLVLAKW